MKNISHMASIKHRNIASNKLSAPHINRIDLLRQPLTRRILAAGLISIILTGCQNGEVPGHRQDQSQPPTVKIAQPLIQEVKEWDEYTGRIEAVESVDVRTRVSGYLEKVNFKAGAKVEKGELLFVIDPRPFKAQLAYAVAELERAKSRRQLAANDLARADNLFKAKAISREEFDARQKGLTELSAAVKSAAANVEAAQLNLEFTQIRSPINGRIGRELMTAGNLIKSDDTLLTTIVSADPVYVYVDADERAVLRYRRQAQHNSNGGTETSSTPVELALSDEAGFPHRGSLDYIAPREDSATGTVTLRGVFANPDELLSPGFFARLRVSASAPYTAMLLPDRAIGTDQAQHFVWIMNERAEVQYRKIAIGAHIGQSRVITQGLNAGDWVVIEGLQKLKPGIKVTAERARFDEFQQGSQT